MSAVLNDAIVAIGSSVPLSVLLKSTLVAAIGLALGRMARRARASVRHLVLASTLAALLALPLLGAFLPAMTIVVAGPAPAPAAIAAPATSGSTFAGIGPSAGSPLAAAPSPAAFGPLQAVMAAWAVGACALAVSFAIALWRLNRLRRRALPWLEGCAFLDAARTDARVGAGVDLLLSEEVAGPLTCGLLRPVILLPMDARLWTESERRRALVHELEHVRRRDWATQLMARAACTVYWFHPLVWVVSRRLSLEAERACDDAVLVVADGADYAEQLVLLARRWLTSPPASTLAMAARSDLAARVSALLDAAQRRGPVGAARVAAAITATSVLVLGMAPLRAARASAPLQASRSDESHIFVKWPGGGAHGPREIIPAAEPVTFDLKDVSLPALLHTLVTNGPDDGQHPPGKALGWKTWPDSYQPPAAVRRLNLVIHAGVHKQVSLKVSARPWNEVFEGLLAENGLGLILDDDLLLIARVEDLSAFEKLRGRSYSGMKITMNFLNGALRDGQLPKQEVSVLGLFEQVTSLHLRPEPTIKGTVTLRILQRPAFEVLALTLAANDLAAVSANEKEAFRIVTRSEAGGEAVDFAALFPPVAGK